MSFSANKKAYFDYEILDTLEAGLVLLGQEVKAIRAGKCSIQGAYVKIISGELFLIGATVSPYQPNNIQKGYDPERSRKLLIKKSQLNHLVGKTEEKGITLVPISLYDRNGVIKLEIGIARGKKKYDKREVIKKRDFKRSRDKLMRS